MLYDFLLTVGSCIGLFWTMLIDVISWMISREAVGDPGAGWAMFIVMSAFVPMCISFLIPLVIALCGRKYRKRFLDIFLVGVTGLVASSVLSTVGVTMNSEGVIVLSAALFLSLYPLGLIGECLVIRQAKALYIRNLNKANSLRYPAVKYCAQCGRGCDVKSQFCPGCGNEFDIGHDNEIK